MEIEKVRAMLAVERSLMPAEKPASAPAGPSFQEIMTQALARVEQDQVEASQAARALAAGETEDLAAVMIASERATLSLGLAVQVRNKLLEAYQEIMRMPL